MTGKKKVKEVCKQRGCEFEYEEGSRPDVCPVCKNPIIEDLAPDDGAEEEE